MDRFGAQAGTLAVAMLWGLWHAPVFFVADSFQAQASIPLFAASIVAWSTIHTALFRYARPSIVTNFAFHACANLSLNLGLSPAPIELYLLAAYVTVGVIILALLGRIRPARV